MCICVLHHFGLDGFLQVYLKTEKAYKVHMQAKSLILHWEFENHLIYFYSTNFAGLTAKPNYTA